MAMPRRMIQRPRTYEIRPCVVGHSGFFGRFYQFPVKYADGTPLTPEALTFFAECLAQLIKRYPTWSFDTQDPIILAALSLWIASPKHGEQTCSTC